MCRVNSYKANYRHNNNNNNNNNNKSWFRSKKVKNAFTKEIACAVMRNVKVMIIY
jgi:hypothetical protein